MPRHSKRARLFSESASTEQHHHEPLKGILKNARIPTKRSVSECVDDLSQLIADFDISIDHLKSGRFCPLHPFPEQAEYEQDSCDEQDRDEDDDDYENESGDEHKDVIEKEQSIDPQNGKNVISNRKTTTSSSKDNAIDSKLKENQGGDRNPSDGPTTKVQNQNKEDNDVFDANENIDHQQQQQKQSFLDRKKKLKGCACYDRYRSDSSDGSTNSDTNHPSKKSVRFDDRVYETVYIASRLYDIRSISKYRLSTRHHKPPNGKQGSNKHNNKKQSKKHVTATLSKSETKSPKPIMTSLNTSSKQKSSSNDQKNVDLNNQNESSANNGCRQTKSQRAKQSKKDKMKRKLQRKDESCSSDDQGYGSSILNFSD